MIPSSDLFQFWLKEIEAVCGGESSVLVKTKVNPGRKYTFSRMFTTHRRLTEYWMRIISLLNELWGIRLGE